MKRDPAGLHLPGSRKRARLFVAALIGALAALLALAQHMRAISGHLDFGMTWFAGREMLRGIDPWQLVGPGLQYNWPWGLRYPATSAVAVLPLSFLPELPATLIFVALSAALLAYALSEKDWDRLWVLASSPFVIAAMAAQWSPLFCAALLMPRLAWVLCAKPTLGLAILISARSKKTFLYAISGGLIILAVSLAIMPQWPAHWMATLRADSSDLSPAITWIGGPVILLALLRWRNADAWLLVLMALVPMTPAWYEALVLLMIPKSRRQCQILSMTMSIGYLMQGAFLVGGTVSSDVTRALLIAFAYLPATILILRQPHPDGAPALMALFARKSLKTHEAPGM